MDSKKGERMRAHVNANDTNMAKLDTHINRIDAFIARLGTQFFLGAGINDIANEYFPHKIIGYGISSHEQEVVYFVIEANDTYSEAVFRYRDFYSLCPCTNTQTKIRNFFQSVIRESKTNELGVNLDPEVKKMMSDFNIPEPSAIITTASVNPHFAEKTFSVNCGGRTLAFDMNAVNISPKQAKSASFSEIDIESINALCETIYAHIGESRDLKWSKYQPAKKSQMPPTNPGVILGPSHVYSRASTLFVTEAEGRSAFCRIFICVVRKIASVEFTQTGSDPNVHLEFTIIHPPDPNLHWKSNKEEEKFSVFLDTDMNFRLKCI
jgi:hypothetical protein